MLWKSGPGPLEKRPFRIKNAVMAFFCPLCRTPRELKYGAKLSKKNVLQIVTLGFALFLISQPIMGARAFFWFFVIWGGFEFCRKLLYRKEIACPHCGFDATWYKKDVRVAKKLVADFWQEKKTKEESPEQQGVDFDRFPAGNDDNPSEQRI